MKRNSCLVFIFSSIFLFKAKAQIVLAHPTYHSIGIQVKDVQNIDSCKIEYRKFKTDKWLQAYPPDKINISGSDLFRGSLFLLDENTNYEIKVTTFTRGNGNTLPIVQQTTNMPLKFEPSSNIKWVSPNGNGNYTQNNPGNITSLFSSGQVTCGTTVLCMDGVYSIDRLSLNLTGNCFATTPIVLMAAPGAKPIFDASITLSTSWTKNATDPNLYSTASPSGAEFSNICVLDNSALYPYPSLNSEMLLGGYNLKDLNFGFSGFVRNEDSIWIKTLNGINPNNSIVKVSKSFRFLTVYGNGHDAFLKIKGIEFSYYGKPVLNPLGSAINSYGASAFDLRYVNHVYFDSCIFNFNTSHISFNNTSNFITIQNCQFKHETGKWTHAMIKKSHVFLHTLVKTISSSRARGIENPAIFLDAGSFTVIRYNLFDGLNSGVEGYFDQGLKQDVDIYGNLFIDNFDAIECDGLWSNLRVWNNEIVRPMAGISAAPPLIGPRYFYRNLIHGMQGRRSEQDDPYFTGCTPIGNNYMGQGIGIKTNSDYTGSIAPGNLYFFNNTFHAADTLGFVFTSWRSEWRKALFINNSYTHELIHPMYYFDLGNNKHSKNFQISSTHDNYYSFKTNSPLIQIKKIHGQYDCTDILTIDKVQSTLSNISGSSSISITNPKQNAPFYTNTKQGGFELKDESLLIDAGIKIPGFYDFKGSQPDIGAKESILGSNSIHSPSTKFQVNFYPNPVEDDLMIETNFKDIPFNVVIYNLYGQVVYNVSKILETKHTINFRNLSNGFYIIEVENVLGKSMFKIVK